MGEALIKGFLATGVSTSDKICASVRSESRQQALDPLNITVFGNALDEGAAQVARNSDIIFLAVRVSLTSTANPVQSESKYLFSSLKQTSFVTYLDATSPACMSTANPPE